MQEPGHLPATSKVRKNIYDRLKPPSASEAVLLCPNVGGISMETDERALIALAGLAEARAKAEELAGLIMRATALADELAVMCAKLGLIGEQVQTTY